MGLAVSVAPAPASAVASGACSTAPTTPAAALRGPDLPFHTAPARLGQIALPPSAWLLPLDALSPYRLHALMALRQKVFAVEQSCAYLDADPWDLEALHLGFGEPPDLMACARIFLPTEDDPSASFGRVVTHPAHRREGLGKQLVAICLEVIDTLAPGVPTFIEAQAYLERFYEGFGFTTFGEPFLEDGIPHLHMERPPH